VVDFGEESDVTGRIRAFVRSRFDDPVLALELLSDWRISYEEGEPPERFADGDPNGGFFGTGAV
jgi:hypothetical protein